MLTIQHARQRFLGGEEACLHELVPVSAVLWSDLKPEDMEDAAKNLQKKLKTGGTKKTKASGAFKGLDKQMRDFLSTCPLIAALRHKSMRPRHWSLLMTGAILCA